MSKYTCCEDKVSDCPCTSNPDVRFPSVPGEKPVAKVVAAGESTWLCTCGASKSYPFCDGSHKALNVSNGTTFKPRQLKNETEEETTFYVCSCEFCACSGRGGG